MWFKNTRMAELEETVRVNESKIFALELENKRLCNDNSEIKGLKAKLAEVIFDNNVLREQLKETKAKLHDKVIKDQAKRNAKAYKKNTHAQKQEA